METRSLRSNISLSSIGHKKVLGVSRSLRKSMSNDHIHRICLKKTQSSYRCAVRLQASQVKTSVVSQAERENGMKIVNVGTLAEDVTNAKQCANTQNTGVRDK